MLSMLVMLRDSSRDCTVSLRPCWLLSTVMYEFRLRSSLDRQEVAISNNVSCTQCAYFGLLADLSVL